MRVLGAATASLVLMVVLMGSVVAADDLGCADTAMAAEVSPTGSTTLSSVETTGQPIVRNTVHSHPSAPCVMLRVSSCWGLANACVFAVWRAGEGRPCNLESALPYVTHQALPGAEGVHFTLQE